MTAAARRPVALVALASLVVAGASCGKKGPPMAPLRPVPSAVADFVAQREGTTVTLGFTIPSTNRDGSTPPAADRVDLYALTQPASDAAPTPEAFFVPANLLATTRIDRREDVTPPPPNAPGAKAEHRDPVPPAATAAAVVRYYGAVAVAGRRWGPASPLLAVPMTATPAAVSGLEVDYTEREFVVTWQPGSPDLQFQVTEESGDARRTFVANAPRITAVLQMGQARCFVVRPALVTGAVTVLGPPTPRTCVTPVDRFAPEPPTGLLAVASDGAVELVWTAPAAPDVAGYVVLRGEGANGTLQRLTTAPIAATQYRDASVRAGVTYVYAVQAMDGATPANLSDPSARHVVTARHP